MPWRSGGVIYLRLLAQVQGGGPQLLLHFIWLRMRQLELRALPWLTYLTNSLSCGNLDGFSA